MNSLGRHPSIKSGEKENSSSRVYVLHETSYRGILRRSCALTAKICTVLLSKAIAFLTLRLPSGRLRCYELPSIMLVFQGNPMGVECSRKKTISSYVYKGRMTTTAVSKTHFRIVLSLFMKAGTNLSHGNEFNF